MPDFPASTSAHALERPPQTTCLPYSYREMRPPIPIPDLPKDRGRFVKRGPGRPVRKKRPINPESAAVVAQATAPAPRQPRPEVISKHPDTAEGDFQQLLEERRQAGRRLFEAQRDGVARMRVAQPSPLHRRMPIERVGTHWTKGPLNTQVGRYNSTYDRIFVKLDDLPLFFDKQVGVSVRLA